MLEAIQGKSLTDEVEEAIYNYIKSEKLQLGDSMPKENELAKMLQVSRPMIREALSRLRMLGLISSRKKRGLIVAKPKLFETVKKIADPQFFTKKEQEDLYNLRIAIEVGLADILVLNLTENDIRKMQEIVELEMSRPDDLSLYLECDYKFHLQIYKATGSESILSFQSILYDFFNDYEERKNYALPDYGKRFEDPKRITHLDILNAIKTKNPRKISEAMRKHLSIHLLRE